MKETIVLFDINETVLDLSVLKPKFRAVLGDEKYSDVWFARLLHMSTVSLVTAIPTDFATLSQITLASLAAQLKISLSPQQSEDILNRFATLPAHPDIQPALVHLRATGFKVVALSNSSQTLLEQQINQSGLDAYFDELISVEAEGTFKPSRQAYLFAAAQLQCPVHQLRLVATHDWDTHGAISAGLKAAYINRTGAIYNPLFRRPEINEPTMGQVVEQIIVHDQ